MTHAVCGDARRPHAGAGHGEDVARGEALATNAELRALLALTDAALSHLALDDLLRELLGRVTAVLGVDNVAILLLDEGSRTLTVRAARGPVEEEIGRTRIPVGQGFSGRIAANREPLIADDLATVDGVLPTMREHLRSAVDVPLLVMGNGEDRGEGQVVGRLVGVLHVGSVAPLQRGGAVPVVVSETQATDGADRADRADPCRPSWRRWPMGWPSTMRRAAPSR